MPDIPDKPLFTLKEVGKLLEVNRKTLLSWITDDILRAHKVGGQYRVSHAELLRIVEGRPRLPD